MSTTGLTPTAMQSAISAIIPGTPYIGLLTAAPTLVDLSDAIEASGSGYARVSMGLVSASDTVVPGLPTDLYGQTNTYPVVFAALTAPLGPIVGFALYDAPGGGNIIAVGILVDGSFNPISKTFVIGDEPTFPAGSLLVGMVGSGS